LGIPMVAIMSEHPTIDMIATIGIPNPERPGSELVKAYIVLKPEIRGLRNPEVLKKELLDFAIDRLAPYEVPKSIEFRDELPLTPVGKIDKKSLRSENAQGRDRRRNMRRSVDLPCDVRLANEGRQERLPGNIVDISAEGVGIETDEPIVSQTGEDAYIDIIQFGRTFWLKGHVLGHKGNRIAVRFIETIPKELKDILNR
ncbi:MAG TPA: PilZ domain-containing protein, partial [Deltaproteobacteria bacterium]|nr:PilZ domain-containing protein [Deltaproteobacteria bacterium]